MAVVHKFIGKPDDYRWENVDIRKYRDKFEGVTRQVFVGPDDDSNNFHMRYFHLEPGTHSNLERHTHEHGVVILHGQARVQLNDEFVDVVPNDAIFIAGDDLHQFVVTGDQPLGFLCVIKAK